MSNPTESVSPGALPFEERLIDVLNAGALCLMISLGHRTGLFDSMAGMPHAKSQEIALRAGLNERYVREWLAAMVCAGVVEYDERYDSYALPSEHSAFLTRAATPRNIAVYAQYIPMLGAVEDDIIECFRRGGGVSYARFGRFQEVMAEDSGQKVLPLLQSDILSFVPGLVERLESGIRVLDVGCGRGWVVNLLANLFPKSKFVGIDLSEDAIKFAREEAKRQGNKNVNFLVRDLSRFDEEAVPNSFDFITTFDAVHDQAKPLNVLRGIRLSLGEDGMYLAQDIKASSYLSLNRGNQISTLLYTISCMHCMTVSLAQNGEGLGAAFGKERTVEYLKKAGFTSIEIRELPHHLDDYYYVCRV